MNDTDTAQNEKQSAEDWKPILRDLFTRRPGTSFVEIQHLPNAGGDYAIRIPNKNIIVWQGLAKEVVDAIGEMLSSGEIVLTPTPLLVYFIDGKILNLPIVKRNRTYKKDHWLPVTVKFSRVKKTSL